MASRVSIQRVWGTLDALRGSYVLRGEGTVRRGEVESRWLVVPDSGTGDLAGLRGDGEFKGRFDEGSTAWLEYWFH
jgi:hypothetical protein